MLNYFATRGAHLARFAAMAVACLAWSSANAWADAVVDWNDVLVRVTVNAGRNAETIAAAGYMHLAVYDAINSIDGRYAPYLTRVPNASASASREAAVAEAAYTILAYLYPAATFPALATQFTTAYTTALNAIPNTQAKADGIAIGHAAAAGLLANRQADNFRANVTYTFPPLAPGVYQKTPGTDGTIATYAGPVTPWLKIFRPFTLLSGSQFRAEPPPALDSNQWAEDFNEVKAFGAASNLPNSRSAEQEEIGLFYGLINPQLQTFRNIQRLAVDQHVTDDIADSARFFAQMSVTMVDAQISCWDSKYTYNFWRPITAIQNAGIDGNAATEADAGWRPQIVTPGHPEYPSAHGCITSAWANAAAEFFGTKRLTGGIWLGGATGHPDRFFVSTDDVVKEIIDARVYNGVHYRTAVVRGAVIGRKAAQWVARFYFQPVDAHVPNGPKH